MMRPPAPANSAPGHGPFSGEDVQEIMQMTGYSYDQVCADINRTGAQSKEQLYPNLYSGQGIEPMQQQPAVAGAAAPPPALAPSGNQTPMTESDTLPPEALEALRAEMAPPAEAAATTPQTDPAWRQRMRRSSRY